ncbi:MAG: TrmH family RNA methyltransferase [bacterium]|nr:TrmH family RNA methyltransferase [bacterium]
MKLNAKELRSIDEKDVNLRLKETNRRPLYFILEDIYDTYNVGGIFRLADALNAEKIYICGQTEIPPNHKIVKASIGTYKVVPWEYKNTVVEAIKELRIKYKVSSIIAVEQDERSIAYTKADYSYPLALILGNETSGVKKETLDACDQIVEIPMWGINKSLNVIVSAAIVSYWAVNKLVV